MTFPSPFRRRGERGLRSKAIAACVILLSFPALSAAVADGADDAVAPLPDDLSDGDLLRLLAHHAAYALPRDAPPLRLPRSVTLDGELQRVAARLGAPALGPGDLAPFHALDPRVQGPLLALVLATERAMDGRDAAFARLSQAEQRELLQLHRDRAPGAAPSARERALDANVDKTTLLAAAIALDDTLEGVVMPQLQAAAQSGAWPPVVVADPIGLLRLGTTHDDPPETLNRMIQIDAGGNDTYDNNAGGAGTLCFTRVPPETIQFPVAISVDMGGNDTYVNTKCDAQGGSDFGIGILLDYGGDDKYVCGGLCQGATFEGVALLRDLAGDDTYQSNHGFACGAAGSADGGVGILRDDGGNDSYDILCSALGYGKAEGSVGLLWDRSGTDAYIASYGLPFASFGYGELGGEGWLVDEGPDFDFYYPSTHPSSVNGAACNDCAWRAGSAGPLGGPNGLGFDNQPGGFAALLAWRTG
jgi:hypothetical protein